MADITLRFVIDLISGEQDPLVMCYKEANEKIEKRSNIIRNTMTKIMIPIYCLPTIFVSYFRYHKKHSADESFHLIIPASYVYPNEYFIRYLELYEFIFRLPYNWKTPISYLFTAFIQLVTAYYVDVIFSCFFLIFFGFCVLLATLTTDILHNLNILEMQITTTNVRGNTISRIKIKKHFSEIIRFHSDAIQLS